MGLPGFNAESSVYRSSLHYVANLWPGSAVSPVPDLNIATVNGPTNWGSPTVPWGLPKCTPPKGDLCGFAGGLPASSAYCCPSGYVCCNPSCSQGSSTCVGCCPKENPLCCLQSSPTVIGGCPSPTTDCGLVPGPNLRFACCPPGETCCNPATHLCCGRKQACCGNRCCPPGQECIDPATGTCCPRGKSCGNRCCGVNQRCCNGTCVDTSTDPSNCGTCGQRCLSGGACQEGICGCPPGTTNCGFSCADLSSDPFNCGGCFNVCASFTCMKGVCACQDGEARCRGKCIPVLSDPSNCGACDNVCRDGKTCLFGVCV